MSFETKRNHFSHTVLDNGFFTYLSEPPSLWKATKLSTEARVTQLCERWPEVAARPNSLRHAYRMWKGGNDRGAAIPALALELSEMARIDTLVRPTRSFPSHSDVSEWLSAMQDLMDALAEADFTYNSGQVPLVAPFWTAGIKLFELVQATRAGSDQFWQYYEPKK